MYKILFYYKNNECWTRIIKTSKNYPNSYKPDLTKKTLRCLMLPFFASHCVYPLSQLMFRWNNPEVIGHMYCEYVPVLERLTGGSQPRSQGFHTLTE